MKINCYIALVAAALACACNPLADTDDMDNNVQATRIAFSPEVVTLDNAGRNAEEDQGQNVIVTLNPKARRSMAWSAETDKTETWCTLTECSVTDADGVTHRGFRITATENTAYKRTATVTLTAADGTQETLRVVQTGVYPDAEVTVDPKQIEFNADEIVPVDVSFTTNMGDVYAVSRDEDADWISWEDLGGNVIRFTAAPWDDEEQPRTANVYITVGSGETSAATAKIPVTQLAKDLYCYVWGASLFDYDRFELARRMTKSETGVYRFDAYFTAGNAPEIRVNTVLRADYYPAYALAADGRIVTLNSAADAVPAGPAIDIDGMRTLTIDLNAMTYTLSRIAIANCMPDDAAAACPSKAFRTKDGGVKIWMTRNLNWNGGPEIGAMKLGSRLVPAYSGSATSGGYDPQDPYIERNPAYDEEESGGSVKGDQAVTDRHGRLYTLDEILLGTPAGGLGRGITSTVRNGNPSFYRAIGMEGWTGYLNYMCPGYMQFGAASDNADGQPGNIISPVLNIPAGYDMLLTFKVGIWAAAPDQGMVGICEKNDGFWISKGTLSKIVASTKSYVSLDIPAYTWVEVSAVIPNPGSLANPSLFISTADSWFSGSTVKAGRWYVDDIKLVY